MFSFEPGHPGAAGIEDADKNADLDGDVQVTVLLRTRAPRDRANEVLMVLRSAISRYDDHPEY
jgi:hypothetical protein